MNSEPASYALIVAGLLFSGFLLFKMFRPPAAKRPEWLTAKKNVDEAKKRARDKGITPRERAKAWRDAALAALEGLARPDLAASYAFRAERLEPGNAEAISLLVVSLGRAERYRALERFLWRRLSSEPLEPPASTNRFFQELIKLYQGPMRRPEIAAGLRKIVNL
jgi:hypothetical protein